MVSCIMKVDATNHSSVQALQNQKWSGYQEITFSCTPKSSLERTPTIECSILHCLKKQPSEIKEFITYIGSYCTNTSGSVRIISHIIYMNQTLQSYTWHFSILLGGRNRGKEKIGFDWSYNWNFGGFNMQSKQIENSRGEKKIIGKADWFIHGFKLLWNLPTWSIRPMFASKKDFIVPISSQYPLKR